MKLSFDYIKIRNDPANDIEPWVHLHRVSSSTEHLASALARVVFQIDPDHLEGGHYVPTTLVAAPKELWQAVWCPLSAEGDLEVLVPIQPGFLHFSTYFDSCAENTTMESANQLKEEKPSSSPSSASTELLTTDEEPDEIRAKKPPTPPSKPVENPMKLVLKDKPRRSTAVQYVPDDDSGDEPSLWLNVKKPKLDMEGSSFRAAVLVGLSKTPNLVIIKRQEFGAKPICFVGVEVDRKTNWPVDRYLRLDALKKIKLLRVQISRTPLLGLYEYYRKADEEPKLGWMPYPMDKTYHLLINNPSSIVLTRAFELTCMDKRKSI